MDDAAAPDLEITHLAREEQATRDEVWQTMERALDKLRQRMEVQDAGEHADFPDEGLCCLKVTGSNNQSVHWPAWLVARGRNAWDGRRDRDARRRIVAYGSGWQLRVDESELVPYFCPRGSSEDGSRPTPRPRRGYYAEARRNLADAARGRRRGRRCGDAAAATWILRGGAAKPLADAARGRVADVAATPGTQVRPGHRAQEETGREPLPRGLTRSRGAARFRRGRRRGPCFRVARGPKPRELPRPRAAGAPVRGARAAHRGAAVGRRRPRGALERRRLVARARFGRRGGGRGGRARSPR